MADNWNSDTGEAVFQTRDDVKNLKIKVRIEKVSAAALSQHLQQQVLSHKSKGAIELKSFPTQGKTGDNEDELVVGWQEKLFSEYEMELYQNEMACQNPLDRQYHLEVKALSKAKHRRNRRIFTYTDHDHYTNSLPFEQLYCTELLHTNKTSPTFLAERMANVRHRRQERRTVDISTSKIINWEPTEEFVKSSHVVNNTMQTMHIMGDLGSFGKLGQKTNEYLLVTIKADGKGTVIIKPDFNRDKGPYRIVTDGDKREVWRLTLENASTAMKPEATAREQNMYKDLYVRHKEYLGGLVGQDFEMPPVGVLRYLVNGEIVLARDFEYDNLHIYFFMELPNGWSTLPFQRLSGVTQTCRTRTLGKDNVAFFSYPFSFEASYVSESESEELVPQWPVLYFKVLSLDSWKRCRIEGFGYLVLPAMPGKHTVTCQTWRPVQAGTVAEMKRFFIGDSPELEDLSYVRIPGTFKGDRLSRFGFRTQTAGSVTFNLHCIQQSKAFIDATMLKRRRQKVFDQLGGFSQQGAVSTIQEAFQRARTRMQEARETLPRDLVNATSILKI